VLSAQAPAQAATVVGIEYQHRDFGGATLTSWVAPNGFVCTGPVNDVDAWFNSVPAGWNDIISSFRGYGACWTRIWEHTNRFGSTFGFTGDAAYVGDAMNDRASSYDMS
jgi:hypothetical protein